MAIFGIGAYIDEQDVSQEFIRANIVGVGWDVNDAPELHQFMRSLKVGDIVYIKAFSPKSHDIIVKGVGIIADDEVVETKLAGVDVCCGRNVDWKDTGNHRIPKPQERYVVRANTMYEEFHPEVQEFILQQI